MVSGEDAVSVWLYLFGKTSGSWEIIWDVVLRCAGWAMGIGWHDSTENHLLRYMRAL